MMGDHELCSGNLGIAIGRKTPFDKLCQFVLAQQTKIPMHPDVA